MNLPNQITYLILGIALTLVAGCSTPTAAVTSTFGPTTGLKFRVGKE